MARAAKKKQEAEVSSPEIDAIVEEIVESGGEWSDELMVRLQQATQSAEGALALVDRITDLSNFVFNARMWVKNMQLQIKERLQTAEMLRNTVPTLFEKDGNGGTLASPVKRDDGTSVSYVSARSTPGVVDPCDQALDHRTTVSGYTEEQVDASDIPLTMFIRKSVYVPDLDLIGKYLDSGQKVGMARRVPPTSSVRIVHPRSLEAADRKIKAAEKKKGGK